MLLEPEHREEMVSKAVSSQCRRSSRLSKFSYNYLCSSNGAIPIYTSWETGQVWSTSHHYINILMRYQSTWNDETSQNATWVKKTMRPVGEKSPKCVFLNYRKNRLRPSTTFPEKKKIVCKSSKLMWLLHYCCPSEQWQSRWRKEHFLSWLLLPCAE